MKHLFFRSCPLRCIGMFSWTAKLISLFMNYRIIIISCVVMQQPAGVNCQVSYQYQLKVWQIVQICGIRSGRQQNHEAKFVVTSLRLLQNSYYHYLSHIVITLEKQVKAGLSRYFTLCTFNQKNVARVLFTKFISYHFIFTPILTYAGDVLYILYSEYRLCKRTCKFNVLLYLFYYYYLCIIVIMFVRKGDTLIRSRSDLTSHHL